MPYAAGTVFLEVAPSFDGLQNAARRAARDAFEGASGEIDNQLGEMERSAERHGEKAGEKWATTFGKRTARQLKQMRADFKALGDGLPEEEANLLAGAFERISKLDLDKAQNWTHAADEMEIIRKAADSILATEKNLSHERRLGLGIIRQQAEEYSRAMRRVEGTPSVQDRAQRQNIIVDVKVARDSVAREKRAIQAELRDLKADIRIGLDEGQAQARITALRARLSQLDRMNVHPDIDVDVSGEIVALRLLEHQLKEVDRASDRAGRGMSKLAAIGGAANAVRLFSGALLLITSVGPILIPLLGGIAAGILGVGAAALAVLGGIGVLVAGLSGIGGAVGAMNDLAKARRTADAGGANQRGAAADARRAVQDARSIADAQRDLARARRDAQQSVLDAAERVRGAERSIVDAQQESLAAQRALNDARAQAVRDLEDMNNQLATARLNERAGEFAVEEAAVRLNVVLEDDQATDREKEVAQLQYEQAVQRLKEQRTETQRLEVDTAKANKAGVEGSERVLEAKAAIVDAAEAERAAERALAEAREDFARQQVQSAERVADAELALTRAYEDVAMRGEEAALATNELSTETDNLAEAMRNLSPAGQAFATWLFGLKPLLDEIRFAAQEGFLPGLQQGMQQIIDVYGPGFVRFVGSVAEALGDVAVMAGEMFTDPFWQDFFGYIAAIAPDIIRDLSEVGLNLLTVFAGVLKAFAPLGEIIVAGLLEITEGWAEWAKGLEDNQGFKDFMDYVQETWPKVSELLGNLFELLLKVIIALEPYADRMLDIFITITDWLLAMDEDTFGKLVTGIFIFINAIQIAAGLIAVIAGVALLVSSQVGLVITALVLLGAGLVTLWNENDAFREGVIDAWEAIKAAIEPVVAWVRDEAIPAWQDFWGNIQDGLLGVAEDPTWNTLNDVLEAFKTAWELAEDAAVVVGDAISWVLENVLSPAFELFWTIVGPILEFFGAMFDVAWQIISRVVGMISQLFTHVFVPLFRAFWSSVEPIIRGFQYIWERDVGPAIQAFLDWIGPAWNSILDLFRTPIRWVIETVINDGLIGAFNWIANRIPGMEEVAPVRVPDALMPGGRRPSGGGAAGPRAYASGTDAMMLPGYTPGRDVHRFVSPTGGVLDLSGGEAVLVPELARALGRDWVLGANKAARRGQGLENYVGGFAGGGFIDRLGDSLDILFRNPGATFRLAGSNFLDAVKDPAAFLRKVVERGFASAFPDFTGDLRNAASAVATAPISTMTSVIKNLFTPEPESSGGPGSWTGGGMGWEAMWNIVKSRFPNARLHSAYRPGSITALGTPSMHGAGRAIDITPSMEIFNFLHQAYGNTKELIFSPAGGRQIYKGKPYFYPEPTRGDHWDHIHWGFAQGGIIPTLYDTGGDVPPGLSVIANKTGKPEVTLTNRFVEEVRANMNRDAGPTVDARGSTFYDATPEQIADELDRKRRDSLALEGVL